MRKSLALILIIFGATATLAVNGGTFDPSLNLYSARQLGMGGLSINFADDANGVFSNPADLTKVIFPQLTSSSRKIMLEETQYLQGAWAMPTNWGVFGLGYVAMGTGGSLPTMLDPATGRIIQNPSLEAGGYSNSVLAFSYSRDVPTLPFNASVGGNLKFFNQSLSGSGSSDKATGNSIDLGATIRPNRWLTGSLVLQNILGGTLKWSSSEDKLGGYYKIGGAINILGSSEEALIDNPKHKLRAGLDLDLPNGVLASSNSMLYHLGCEYSPIENITLRAGLNQEVSGTGLTFGVGMVNSGFRFDYAYVQRPGLPGDNPHYFSLTYIGERVLTILRKLKSKVVNIKVASPRHRLITDREFVDISAEAIAQKVLEKKRTWTVTAVSATSDAFDITEDETLAKLYLNGKLAQNPVTIEVREKLEIGRNIFKIVGFASPESPVGVPTGSAEVAVLRFIPFADTPMDHWAIDPIALTVTLELVKGYPDNSFRPEKGITRAELLTLLVRSLELPAGVLETYSTEEAYRFKDVKASSWAAPYIAYGTALKLVTGYPNGTFKPTKVLSRAEAVVIFARYAGLSENLIAVAPPYPDLKPDFWANRYITSAKGAELLRYLEGKEFKPSANFTRAEACEVLSQVSAIKKKIDQYWETGIISASQP